MDTICAYCTRAADHVVGSITVCDHLGCETLATRDQAESTPLSDLLARYGSQPKR